MVGSMRNPANRVLVLRARLRFPCVALRLDHLSQINSCDVSRNGRLLPAYFCEPPIDLLGGAAVGLVGIQHICSRTVVFQFRVEETLNPLLRRVAHESIFQKTAVLKSTLDVRIFVAAVAAVALVIALAVAVAVALAVVAAVAAATVAATAWLERSP